MSGWKGSKVAEQAFDEDHSGHSLFHFYSQNVHYSYRDSLFHFHSQDIQYSYSDPLKCL